jgi:hypothetical protein
MPAEVAAFGGEFVVSAQAPHTLPAYPLQLQAADREEPELTVVTSVMKHRNSIRTR